MIPDHCISFKFLSCHMTAVILSTHTVPWKRDDIISSLSQYDKSEHVVDLNFYIHVKSMQRSGTYAIGTPIQPSKKTKTEYVILQIVKIQKEHLVNRVSSYFRSWPLSNRNRTKHNTRKYKVKRQRHSDTKNR